MTRNKHPFGILITKYRNRIGYVSQANLATKAELDPSVLSDMCNGRRLSGPQLRSRVVDLVRALQTYSPQISVDEANDLLQAAGLAPLNPDDREEAEILRQFRPPEQENEAAKSLAESGSVEAQENVESTRQASAPLLWLIALSLVGVVAIGAALLIRQNGRGSETDICAAENVTCLGDGWCKVAPTAVEELDGTKLLTFGREADLNNAHFVYFRENFVEAGDLHSRSYDAEGANWSFVISDNWAANQPGWDEIENWFVTVKCQ